MDKKCQCCEEMISTHADFEECEHQFDGGHCLECNIKSLCELCDEEEWETVCDICAGGRICDNCYFICYHCDQKICKVCKECDYCS